MNEYKCKRCNKNFEKYTSLCRHVSKVHKIKFDQFYVEFYLNNIWPTCKCGCKKRVVWSRSLKGFRNFVAGHQSRICNNWGNNPTALKKSLKTRIQRFASKELTTWNCGLTKETDYRVKNNGEQSSKSINSNPDEIKRRSKMMSENRKNGIVPTLYGSKSSQWKGGISEINNIARSDKRLYIEWKYPILIRDEFKCKECGNTENLHIHHDKETMSEIVKKHVIDEGIEMEFELKKSISEKIVDYHITNKVSGITLCGKCHEKYHPSLNFD